jgi:hypothetical protein
MFAFSVFSFFLPFQPKSYMHSFPYPLRHMPRHLSRLHFIMLISLGKAYELRNSSLCRFFLTSYNLNFSITVMSKPVPCRCLTIHAPNFMPRYLWLFIQRIRLKLKTFTIYRDYYFLWQQIFGNMPKLQAGGPPIAGRLTAYSVYSQVASICGDLFFHPQPEDPPCNGEN